jgi:hypothetical protein
MIGKDKGYEITFDRAKNIIKARLWGFWDAGLGKQYIKAFEEKIQEVIPTGKEWSLLVDITKFAAQPREVQRLFSEGMTFAKQHGVKKTARIVASTTTQLQFERLSKEANLAEIAFFQSEEEALQWLLS